MRRLCSHTNGQRRTATDEGGVDAGRGQRSRARREVVPLLASVARKTEPGGNSTKIKVRRAPSWRFLRITAGGLPIRLIHRQVALAHCA